MSILAVGSRPNKPFGRTLGDPALLRLCERVAHRSLTFAPMSDPPPTSGGIASCDAVAMNASPEGWSPPHLGAGGGGRERRIGMPSVCMAAVPRESAELSDGVPGGVVMAEVPDACVGAVASDALLLAGVVVAPSAGRVPALLGGGGAARLAQIAGSIGRRRGIEAGMEELSMQDFAGRAQASRHAAIPPGADPLANNSRRRP